MKERTKAINEAIVLAKRRDNYRCLVCAKGKWTGDRVDGAHLMSRNGSHGIDPRDANFIITLCREHHLGYDLNIPLEFKIAWLERKDLDDFADRLRRRCDTSISNNTK